MPRHLSQGSSEFFILSISGCGVRFGSRCCFVLIWLGVIGVMGVMVRGVVPAGSGYVSHGAGRHAGHCVACGHIVGDD